MTNKHVELIKRWREDPGSVSRAELRAAWAVAYDDAEAASSNAAADAEAAARASADADAAYYAVDAAYAATHGHSGSGDAAAADYWIKKYEELVNG